MKKILVLTLLLASSMMVFSQGKILHGKVMEEGTGNPLVGATINVVGQKAFAVSDTSGSFNLRTEGKTILVVSYIGYKTKTIDVTSKSLADVILSKDITNLDETVVIGYGTQRKKDLTSAISTISGKDIKDIPVTSVNAALQGRVPGMQVNTSGNQPGAGAVVTIRGINSITQGAGPLYVVDGVLINGDINELNPNDIASIDVLKDASAAAIYGSRASEGVILITTKKAVTGRSTLNYDVYYGVQNYIMGKATIL